jgi:hypothetical protein
VLILGTTPTDLVPLGKITDPERLKHLLVDPMASPRSSSGAAVYSDDSQKGHRAS